MSEDNICKWRERILGLIESHRLRDAFVSLRSMVPGQSWKIMNELDRTEEAYAYMLNYAMDGVQDPHRRTVYDDIVSKLYALVDCVTREQRIPGCSSLYFNTVRYENLQFDTIASLLDAYYKLCDRTSLFNMAAAEPSSQKTHIKEKEQLELRLFAKVWTSCPLSHDDEQALSKMWNSDIVPSYFKELMVSALLLGLTEYFEENRMMLLLDAYAVSSPQISMKAMTALAMMMSVYRTRMGGKRIADRIAAMRDTTSWSDDIRTVYLQLIRSRDTEKINKKVRDELMPQMMKLRPDLSKFSDNASVADLSQFEENPEWQEMLEKSGVADKMKELSEMQEDGSDVLMSTFAMLKTFPFFNDVANWFMPFHTDHSAIADSGRHDESVAELLLASPFLCNGDKYSFYFSLGQVPEAQRSMMLSQINSQNINFAELRNSEMLADGKKRENIANKYVQDLYRFFKLFRRKGEFNDPFSTSLNMWDVPVLRADLSQTETLRLVSEFYFKHGYYADALTLFKVLVDMVPPDAQLFQKMGYALQQAGDITGALDYYEKAELLNADNVWTMKRMAACHKILGNTAKALEYFMRIEQRKPDDMTIATNIGHCLMALGRDKEAMNYYYKVEFQDESNSRIWRPLAWCSFVNREFDTSRRYYDKIMHDGAPSAVDYMNMGHLAVAIGNYREAVGYYKHSLSETGTDVDRFVSDVRNDYPSLAQAGVDVSIMPLVIDAVLYSQ